MNPSNRDWPEDFSHENGNYSCRCVHCGKPFIGHKRRVTCKQCSKDMVKVGVFTRIGRSGKRLHAAYTVWYNPQWLGCCEHYVQRGKNAKRHAIEQHKDACEAGFVRRDYGKP